MDHITAALVNPIHVQAKGGNQLDIGPREKDKAQARGKT